MIKKKIASGLLCLVLIFTCFAIHVHAAEVAQEQSCTLTVGFHYDETAVPGVQFDIFYAAEFENYTVTPAAPFDSYPVSYDIHSQDEWNELAETFKGFVLRDGIKPTASGVTDEEGWAVFKDLKPGLYFVLGYSAIVDEYLYTSLPFFSVLPGIDEETGETFNEVTAEAKREREKIETEPDQLKILKIWNDSGSESSRPKEIEVTLLCDKEQYETVKLNAENNWRYEWNDLEPGHDWSVAEKEVSGYSVAVEQKGITYTLTNTLNTPPPPGEKTPPSKLPYTGMMRWPIPVLIIAGLVCIIIGLIRRRSA